MKITQKNVISVQDWDALVKETYKRPYSFQQQDGCKNRGVHELTVPEEFPADYEDGNIPETGDTYEMGVSFEAWLARDPKQPLKDDGKDLRNEQWAIDLWWDRNFYPDITMVANDLHAKGLLPAGEYLIKIEW